MVGGQGFDSSRNETKSRGFIKQSVHRSFQMVESLLAIGNQVLFQVRL